MQCVAMCTCVCGKMADMSVNTTACIILNVYVMSSLAAGLHFSVFIIFVIVKSIS